MLEHPQLRIQIASDVAYDQLVAEIYCDEQFVGLICQDRGLGDLEFSFPEIGSSGALRVPLDWLFEALRKAQALLLERAK